MKFPSKAWLGVFIILLSSCQTTDPFTAETSSLSLASQYLSLVMTPEKDGDILASYELLSTTSREALSYSDYFEQRKEKARENEEAFTKSEWTPWEKFDLSDGSSLVYVLHKFDYSRLLRKFKQYAIFRIHVMRENGEYRVVLEPRGLEDRLAPMIRGQLEEMTEVRTRELKDMIREDASKVQFHVEIENEPDQETKLADQLVQNGEAFYDLEKYREALMQFDKALKIDPNNQRAKIYMERCKKALQLGLEKAR